MQKLEQVCIIPGKIYSFFIITESGHQNLNGRIDYNYLT
jgi:hypothetical protein